MLSPTYFTFSFVFTSISLKVGHAGSSHNYFNHLKRYQPHLWNWPVRLYTSIEYGMKSLFIKLCKWSQIEEQVLIPHVGSHCGSPTEKQILIGSRQNKPEREGEESDGFFQEGGLESWRSKAEAATISEYWGGIGGMVPRVWADDKWEQGSQRMHQTERLFWETLLALAKRILKGKSLKLPRERTLSSKLQKECMDKGRRNLHSGLKTTES